MYFGQTEKLNTDIGKLLAHTRDEGAGAFVMDAKDIDAVSKEIFGKTIMVTGGGGSIGSELCLQISTFRPKTLVIVDIYENGAYELECELREKYPELDVAVVIASAGDEELMSEVFEKYSPYAVFHAAAHKHVPLMEKCPREAVRNNVFSTYVLSKLADRFDVKKFVLISTDKAVNPASVMGATKKICELIVASYKGRSKTVFSAVRFGNVLGSAGSVFHLFKRQIESGGPVTVTHPDITRYFMSIPEAARLVLMATTLAEDGEIFVLDMGKQIKILDLAKKMIELSGHIPGEDIKIEITGIRPGEKLYEELTTAEENLGETSHKKIFVARAEEISAEELENKLSKLESASSDEKMRETLKSVITTYK